MIAFPVIQFLAVAFLFFHAFAARLGALTSLIGVHDRRGEVSLKDVGWQDLRLRTPVGDGDVLDGLVRFELHLALLAAHPFLVQVHIVNVLVSELVLGTETPGSKTQRRLFGSTMDWKHKF